MHLSQFHDNHMCNCLTHWHVAERSTLLDDHFDHHDDTGGSLDCSMSKKKDTPPPRPPAPKLTLNKPGNRQGSIGAMAVHYNCLKEDDDGGVEEDVVFDPGTFSNATPAMKRISATNNAWSVQQKQSRSAPSSEATSPVSTSQRLIGQTSLDQGLLGPDEDAGTPDGGEKSILFGLREKLNDPLNALIVKIEQISSDTVFADIVERKLKKSDSMDSTRSGTAALDQKSGEVSNSRRNIQSASDSITCDETIAPVDAQPLLNANIIDTSYSNDVSAKSGTTELTENHRDKSTPSSAQQGLSSPMTLSGLLLNSDENNLDDIPSNNDTESIFYDTRESPPITGEKVPPKRPDSPRQKSMWSKLPFEKIIGAVVCFLAILVIPFPSFVSGLLVGVAVTFCVFKLQRFLTEPSRPKEPFELSDIETLPPMCVPEMRESKNEDGKFKVMFHTLF